MKTKLGNYLKKKGIPKQTLAKQINRSPCTIYNYCSGKPATRKSAERILIALDEIDITRQAIPPLTLKDLIIDLYD